MSYSQAPVAHHLALVSSSVLAAVAPSGLIFAPPAARPCGASYTTAV
ncbi:MAG: hypothetical protein GY696_26080 [Gammaproteobacteria bacterium]|nr:hypothetical protein [Gammaproteobacteria bacterium]